MLRSKLLFASLASVISGTVFAQTGTTFCAATNNSTGAPAVLTGSFGSGVGSDLHLEVSGGVPNEIGYFLVGNEVTAGVMITEGLNCLIGPPTAQMFRYSVAGTDAISVGRFDNMGVLQNLVGTSTIGTGFDVPDMIPAGVPIPIMSGDMWHFQAWYRDTVVMSSNSNFSNGLSVTFNNGPQPSMVLIPAGTFSMGSNAAAGSPYFGDSTTQPVHDVTISQDFWMGEHEVTQAEYSALMGSNPSYFVGPTLPVEQVSWYDAVAYCTALTAQEMALGNVPVGYRYRLPTEAEWEYACRAGTTTEFNVGADIYCTDAHFWYSFHNGTTCGVTGTADVGSYPANSLGLYDMHGNVREWCLDANYAYSAGAATDPLGTIGANRIIRGGSWDENSFWSRSAFRGNANPSFSNETRGFRVVLAPILVPEPIAGMVPIPAGMFNMGSDAASGFPYYGSSDTQPVHGVTISQDFWMGEHEVTQAEYQALMGVNPSAFVGSSLPVEQVSWNDSVAYCAALTAQEVALGNLPAGFEYRLPTEAEWEYACRAGTTTEFNVGADLYCADARFSQSHHSNSSCGVSSTIDVGSYPANAFGLHDMHGNVFEWCLDSWSSYIAGAVTDPFVTGGSNRVFRGGGWIVNSNFCRSAYRVFLGSGVPTNHIGFRVVLGSVLVP